MTEAYTILNWFENLPEEDQPPQEIWGHDDAVSAWFEDVKIRRGSSDSSGQMERVPEASMTQDTLAARMIGDLRG